MIIENTDEKGSQEAISPIPLTRDGFILSLSLQTKFSLIGSEEDLQSPGNLV